MRNSRSGRRQSASGRATRREFLRNGTIAATGLALMGSSSGQSVAAGNPPGNPPDGAQPGAPSNGSGLKLISPSFETSPQYLATYPASDRARRLMQQATVIDTLFSAVYPLQWKSDDQFHPVMRECIAAGINVLGYCTSADVASPDPAAVLAGLKFPLRKIAERPDLYVLVRSVDDIREAKKQGKLGIYFVHQGTNQFGADVDNVALMRQLGFGYCLLVYNNSNAVGGGCADAVDRGLTPFGRRLIQAYNRYGMVVDVTHTGNRTALDACEVSAQPVIASHSGAKGVFASFRNLSDDLIKAIAGTGGVCSIFSTGAYVDPSNPAVVGPEILFKHIDYICQLVGSSKHAGYGSDWIPDMNKTMELVLSKASAYPDMGMPPGTTKKAISMYGPTPMPARILPALVDQMLNHGYSDQDCANVLGENNLRVFGAVWGGSSRAIVEHQSFQEDWR